METLANFIGNRQIVEELSVEIEASKLRRTRLDHMLLTGPAGTGKTKLARIVANELGVNILDLNSPQITDFEKDVLTRLKFVRSNNKVVALPTIIFFDEAHELHNKVQQLLLKVLLDGYYTSNSGVVFYLNHCTFVLATTNAEGLFGPLKMRCQLQFNFNKYTNEELAAICKQVTIEDNGDVFVVEPNEKLREYVAKRSRRTPRIALQYMQRVYNHIRSRCVSASAAMRIFQSPLSIGYAEKFFNLRRIDENGLGPLDLKYLEVLSQSQRSRGLNAIASQMQIDIAIIKDEIEPFLAEVGFITFEAKGRKITDKGRSAVKNLENNEVELGDSTITILPFAL